MAETIQKTPDEILGYKNIKNDFVDYTRFEDDAVRRNKAKDDFINNRQYLPDYKYPSLDFLIDKEDITRKKADILEAIMELQVAEKNGDVNVAELKLYQDFHELRLKKIMLVEAARELTSPMSLSTIETRKRSFAEINEAVYGPMNENYYLGMIATEKKVVQSFVPTTERASVIKSDLDKIISSIDTGEAKETELLNPAEMQKLHDFIIDKYADILSVVPDTPDDVYYDAEQCAEIMNKALAVGGFTEKGWTCSINAKKSSPVTLKKVIYLPSNTKRNAAELRRLIIHEQEVHARRAQNGEESGFKPLRNGTADYADVEEGLGVLMECAVDGTLDNPSFDRARDRYITAGLALGIDGVERDARQVYETVWRLIAVRGAVDGDISEATIADAKDKAYSHIENAYRGTPFSMRGVIYTKLKVYYEGIVKNVDYYRKNIQTLESATDDAMIGKHDHTSDDEADLIAAALTDNKE
jgi:uncharacterized protein YfkK (UPF0435 family)